MKSLGFDLNSMLIACTFYQLPCSANDFTEVTTFDNGICFIYNFKSESKNVSTSFKTGIDSGLSLELFGGVSGLH